jgi:hypothetical protein
MKRKKLLLALLTIIPFLSFSQAYLVGTSQASIEPDQSLISLHLGGYGAPRDGRFSLQWINKGNVPEVTAMSGVTDKLFILSNNELLWMNPFANGSKWQKAGKAQNIRCIAGFKDKIYAVANNGDLLETNVKGSANWQKIGSANNAVAIAASDKRLFISDGKGSLWSADRSKNNREWVKLDVNSNVVSLAFNNGKLYGLTDKDEIFQFEPWKRFNKWMRIAYKNGQTINEDIKLISIVNDRIFGVSKENILYKGEHRTDGNLTARAMAIKNEDKTAVIVSVDVCGLNDTFTGMVKDLVFKKNHIPASAIFINSSHTHFAPVSQNWLTWQESNQRPDSIFLYNTVKNGILDAIDGAVKSMKPADLYLGRGKTDIGYNRTLRDHQELYDNTLDVLKVSYKDNTESYLFLAACHAVFSAVGKLHYTVSANFPGVARKLLEERTGTANSMYLQGTAGDINPKDNGEYITGEKLSNDVITILNKPMQKITGPISCFLDTINIAITPWPKEKINEFRAKNAEKPGDIVAEKNVKWCDLMLRYYDEGIMPSSLPVYINTFNIGNWKLVGFSRETTTPYGFGVKQMWPDKLISVAGYTNDVSSYLPTNLHIERKVYEGLDSFFWYGMPEVFPMNVEDIILTKIKTLER